MKIYLRKRIEFTQLEINEAIEILVSAGITTNKNYWVKKIQDDEPMKFLLCKIAKELKELRGE